MLSPSRRSSRAPRAWKVPSHIPEALSPTSCSMRVRISRAALLVKVTARISDGLARPVATRWAMRQVSTRVLPLPAPAKISSGPSGDSTARRCASLSPSRRSVGTVDAVTAPR